eukprot:TRINITY_DN19259_c0_g1_i1.p3 TRINITY_DN19259_c0_g1~~TRINITY_DN19259_c0_g1_i1.p3  ORF type:complete len:260 (-),score=55.17 TRINITY_DN19259_c0_g1_i1:104-883(-)
MAVEPPAAVRDAARGAAGQSQDVRADSESLPARQQRSAGLAGGPAATGERARCDLPEPLDTDSEAGSLDVDSDGESLASSSDDDVSFGAQDHDRDGAAEACKPCPRGGAKRTLVRATTLPLTRSAPVERDPDGVEVFVRSPTSAAMRRRVDGGARLPRSASWAFDPAFRGAKGDICRRSDGDNIVPDKVWREGVSRRTSEQMMFSQLKLLSAKHAAAGRSQKNVAGANFNMLYGRTRDILEELLVCTPPRRRHSAWCEH